MKAITIIISSALITAASLKAVPALAEPTPATTEIAVSTVATADLNLRTKAGLRELDQRLAKAARDVCGQASNADLEGKNDVRRCRNETLARAQPQRDFALAATQRGAVIAVTAAR